MKNKLIDLLIQEYDSVLQVSTNSFECSIKELNELHIVTIKGNLLEAYNPVTTHKWLIN